MHKALLLLLKLRFRGMLRRLVKGLQKPTGILLALFGAGLLTLWFGPMLFRMIFSDKHPVEPFARYIAPAIALLLIVNVISRFAKQGAQFTRADVDLLFPAPFARRDLLLYKCAEMLAAAGAIGLFFSLMLGWFETPWIATFIAIVFVLQFVNLVSMAASMADEPVRRLMRGFAPKVILIAVIALIAFIASNQIQIDPDAGLWANIDAALEAPIVQAALLPLQPFANMLAAESLAGFLFGAVICIALMIAVFALILRLDARTIDATVARSHEYQKQLQQAKKHAGMVTRISARSARLRLAPLPWLGGAGPILWKQLTTAMRSISSMMIPIIMMLGIFGGIVLFLPRDDEVNMATPLSITIIAMLSVSLPQMLFFDFRRDLDQMDWLKRLPIRPLPLAVGQVLTPALITTALQWLLLIFAAAFGALSPGVALSLAALALPFNLLNVAIENAGFLTFPTRQLAVGIADFIAFSRMMLLFMLRFIVLAACAGIAALLGWIAYLIAGGSWPAFVIGTTIGLTIAAAASLPVVAMVFARFDVSRDLPAA